MCSLRLARANALTWFNELDGIDATPISAARRQRSFVRCPEARRRRSLDKPKAVPPPSALANTVREIERLPVLPVKVFGREPGHQ